MWKPIKHLERSLVADGRPAQAEVLSAQPVSSLWRTVNAPDEDIYSPYDIALRVIPEGEPEFELHLKKMQIPMLVVPTRGMRLQVLYDPNDHEQIVIDPRTVPANKDETIAQYQQAAMSEMFRRAMPTPPAQSPELSPEDLQKRLAKLDALREAGALTDQEHAEARQRLIDQF